MDELSARFLGSFNDIEDHLRQVCKAGPGRGFVKLVHSAKRNDPTIRHFSDDLREFAELRNAITHQYDGESVIATPRQRADGDRRDTSGEGNGEAARRDHCVRRARVVPSNRPLPGVTARCTAAAEAPQPAPHFCFQVTSPRLIRSRGSAQL